MPEKFILQNTNTGTIHELRPRTNKGYCGVSGKNFKKRRLTAALKRLEARNCKTCRKYMTT